MSSAEKISAKKSRLRTLYLSRRKKLSESEIRDYSKAVCSGLTSLSDFKKASSLALFYPKGAEVNTTPIFKRSIKNGTDTCFPRVSGKSLHFYKVNRLSELSPGYMGVFEPDAAGERLEADDIDLVLVPGLAFDLSGGRLGFGGGFYDRFLKKIPVSKTVALAFDFQIADHIPVAGHDVKIGRIITESRVINCSDEKGGIKCKP